MLIEKYIQLNESNDLINEKTLDEHRRYVSQYYQLFATYYFEKLVKRKATLKFWTLETLEIINTILYPIEALTKITGVNTISKKVNYMNEIYNVFKN
jgi:hypothetical protein